MRHAAEATTDARALFGHDFARPELLREALTHRSAVGPGGFGSNERLEFVGDRVLGLIVAEWLAERFPGEREGELGPRLAHLVARPTLAQIADEIGLGGAIAMNAGEIRKGVRTRATVLSDALEAAIGALYLDGGLEAARRFVRAAWGARIEAQARPPKDPKTALQEYTLARGWGLPDYAIAGREGPPHAPAFRVRVTVPQAHAASRGDLVGEGAGGSKRMAERAAAADLMARLSGLVLVP